MSKSTTKTRAARTAFLKAYGKVTARVLQLLASGYSTSDVSRRTGLKVTSVATYKANMSRGAYSPWVSKNGTGTCNFKG